VRSDKGNVDFEALFFREVKNWGIGLDEGQFTTLRQFWQLLEKWNRRINLVSVKNERDFFLLHLLDALSPLPFLPTHDFSLIDLGTGAGLPGIPLKIMRPEIDLTLLDASRRRTSFLREVRRQLFLSRVTVINDRAENVTIENDKKKYDVVVSRATWKLPKYLDLAGRFLAPGGMLIALKGQIPGEEWSEAMKLLEIKEFFLEKDVEVILPDASRRRRVLIFKKQVI